MKLMIYVTASDIIHGVRDNCDRCPVANAVRRAFNTTGNGLAGRMNVSCEAIYLWTEDSHWSGAQSPEMVRFIDAFDGDEQSDVIKAFQSEIELAKQE